MPSKKEKCTVLIFLPVKTPTEDIFHLAVVLLSQPENCAALRLNF